MKIALLCTDSDLWGFGIRLLSATLRRAGHSPVMIFLSSDCEEYSEEVLNKVAGLAGQTDLIGISCFSRGAHRAEQVATRLRSLHKPLVWGGVHATLNPQHCASFVDAVCRGEGEETIIELAECVQAGRSWDAIQNLAYLKGGELIVTPQRPPTKELDSLPLFDFERTDEFHLRAEDLVPAPPASTTPRGQVLFIGSRGCAFHCTYCCNRKLKDLYAGHRGYLRRMSVGRYVEHLAALRTQYFPLATDFFLMDEDFFLRSASELEEFSRLYREKVGIPFECMVSPATVSRAKVEALARAGLWRIRMGIESGSERTKKEVYDRKLSNDLVERAASAITGYRSVVPCYFFIIGNPYEEEADLVATIRFLARLPRPYYSHMYNLVFFPGSELYDRAIRDRIITSAGDSACELHFRSGFHHKHHSWKKKNLYLNAVIFLAEGKATWSRIGLLPRPLIPVLTSRVTIRVLNRAEFISEGLIAGKIWALSVRARIGAALKSVMRDPTAVYNLRDRFMRPMVRARVPAGAARVETSSDHQSLE